jgi:hypothetical protein
MLTYKTTTRPDYTEQPVTLTLVIPAALAARAGLQEGFEVEVFAEIDLAEYEKQGDYAKADGNGGLVIRF